MVRVSLVALTTGDNTQVNPRLASIQAALEAAGYAVDAEPIDPSPAGTAAQAIAGIRSAAGDLIVVVDLAMAYTPNDVRAVVDALDQGPASLVVAARSGRWLNSTQRRVFGTTDPTSGLVGLTHAAAQDAMPAFAPVGTRFTCELLARVAGARADVPVGPVRAPRRRWVPLDDVRHAKRIADDRLGTVSRLLQFCFVGASGMVIDLSTYAVLLAILARTPLQDRSVLQVVGGKSITLAEALAGLLAIATAIVWNFSLNRRLTFNDARRGSIVHQFGRYLLSNLAGCAVSLAFRLLLPSRIPFFARHRLAAAVTGIVAATGISFSLARWFVFTNRTQQPAQTEKLPVGSTHKMNEVHAPGRTEAVVRVSRPAAGIK